MDVGGGVDIAIDTSSMKISDPLNIVFPASLVGRWICERTILSVEGDSYQAQSAWKALGSGGATRDTFGQNKKPERYETRFVEFNTNNNKYAVLDRSFEYISRTTSTAAASEITTIDTNNNAIKSTTNVVWDPNQPNMLQISGKNNFEMAVIQRSVIPPNLNQGIVAGGQELFRETDGPFVKAFLVKQRFRPGSSSDTTTTSSSSSSTPTIIEGLELVKTYRVLDGIAGTEFPTSTTKTLLKLTRLPPQQSSNATEAATTNSMSYLYFDGSAWY